MNRDDFKYNLQKYINGGCLTRTDRLIYFVSPKILFKKNAGAIQSGFKKVSGDVGSLKEVDVKVYDGKSGFVINLINFLESNLKDQLAGAYVHGSLGTNEEIAYSDFDALVILKDEIINDKDRLAETAFLLNKARTFMFQMDPLQHHGWFVMAESDLSNYSETYFPSELFRYAKSLLKDKGLRLTLNVQLSEDFSAPLISLCNSVERKLKTNLPENLYQLKNLLSEFMLLPALYVQARDKKGIYKKFSFEEAKKDFSSDSWKIMDEVSLIRKNWNVNIPEKKKQMIASGRFFSPAHFSPGIPDEMKLNDSFYKSMLDFTRQIRKKIK